MSTRWPFGRPDGNDDPNRLHRDDLSWLHFATLSEGAQPVRSSVDEGRPAPIADYAPVTASWLALFSCCYVRVPSPAVTGGRDLCIFPTGCCGTKGTPAGGVLKSTLPIIAPPRPTASGAAGLSKSRMALLACPAGGPFCPRSPWHRWLFMSEGLARVARKGPGPPG